MSASASAVLAVVICAGGAALEGTLAGRGIRARFGELRLPRLSPPLGVWFLIGGAYYVICFTILYRLLASNLPTSTHSAALILVHIRKDLRASFLAFFPYGLVTLALLLVLTRIDSTSALLLAPYLAYLGYALWWAHRVWVLNRA